MVSFTPWWMSLLELPFSQHSQRNLIENTDFYRYLGHIQKDQTVMYLLQHWAQAPTGSEPCQQLLMESGRLNQVLRLRRRRGAELTWRGIRGPGKLQTVLGISEALYADSERSSCVYLPQREAGMSSKEIGWRIVEDKRDRKNFLHKLLVWDDKQPITFHVFPLSLAKTYNGEWWYRRC